MTPGSLLTKLNRRRGLFCGLIVCLLITACGTLEVDLAPTAETTPRPGVPFTPTPWFGPANFATEAGVVFDDRLRLQGYTVKPESLSLITVTLFWEVLAEIDADYNTFVHVFNEHDQLLAQSDLPTGGGWRLSPDWLVKEVVYDQHKLVLPDSVGLDEVEIRIGLYDFNEGRRLNIEDPGSFTLEIVPSPTPVTKPPKQPPRITLTPSAQAPGTPIPRPTESPEIQESTADPQLGSQELRIAYIKDQNIWLWEAGAGPLQLTEDGGIEDVWISDDGQYVAFLREGDLWAAASDGTQEQQLTTGADFQELDLGDEQGLALLGIQLVNVAWRPGSHELFFITSPQYEGPGLFLSDDLWKVDVDFEEVSMILPPGEGGQFYFSPDGRKLAVVTPGHIDLIEPDGSNRREAFTHTPVITYSEFEYYAQPVWAADSSSLRVAIPPTDFLAPAVQPTSIWYIPVEDQPARLIGEITSHSGLQLPPFFAPDFSRLAYLVGDQPENRDINNQIGIGISEMSESVIWDPVLYEEEIRDIYGWSPDGMRFLMTIPTGSVAEIVMGQPGIRPLVSGQDLLIYNLTWTDNYRFLYAQVIDDIWHIFLGYIDRGEPDLIDSGVRGPDSYDFTWVPVETAEN